MKFDDRLATVIGTAVSGDHDRAVRWRQLVDLVSRAGAAVSTATIDAAVRTIAEERDRVDPAVRSATARSIAGRDLPDALLAIFAKDRVEVAAPLLTAPELGPRMRGFASPEVRRFLDALTGQSSNEAPAIVAPPSLAPPSDPIFEPNPRAVDEPIPSIGEVVARIEQLRASRERPADTNPAPSDPSPSLAPPGSVEIVPDRARTAEPTAAEPESIAHGTASVEIVQPALFRWECGPSGEIDWVDGAPRGALVGRSLARGEVSEGVAQEVGRAFARRAPFRDEALALPDLGAVAGDWLISGVPAFAPGDGRFVGYRGVARRHWIDHDRRPGEGGPLDPASLRELVHEIKTPLNAIVGFAEIIDGQYLGPAHGAYRQRAREIVGHAGTLLGAVDDLDFVARLRGADSSGATTVLTELLAEIGPSLAEEAERHGARLVVDLPDGLPDCAIDPTLASRLASRFAMALLAKAGPGETLRLAARTESGSCMLRMSRPRALERADEGTAGQGLFAGVEALAQLCGSGVSAEGAELVLRLPLER